MIRSTAEATRKNLITNTTQQKTVPDTTNHNATKQCLISFPNMRRIKELQRAMNIQQRTTTKTLSPTEVSSKLIAPSIKNSRPKMLNGTSQITQQGQTRPNPGKSNRIPPKTNLSSTTRKKMNRTMTRTTITNHVQKTINPTNLSRPKGTISPKQAKPIPHYAKSGVTPSGPIQ